MWFSFGRVQSPHFIAKGASVEGQLSFDGDLRVDGQFSGLLIARGACSLTVSKGAVVRSDELLFESVDVFGTVSARFIKAARITLHPGSRVTGHLQARSIEIKEGAAFDGEVSIQSKSGVKASISDFASPSFSEPSSGGTASVARERLLRVKDPAPASP